MLDKSRISILNNKLAFGNLCVYRNEKRYFVEMMAEINDFQWPGEYIQGTADLKRLIGKYKLKEAGRILKEMTSKLKQ